ncbi:MarR family transcriptional regulator [Nocardia sp. NBC_00508]|uniref:helix-turn-helix domain-containing protein n=1 Tax=Nocardia sp. NBC_00508 TaxID=2975992 RepID=UPI002E80CD52|nr:helix-turn-helix domain-containing protein [Nocardia sp. NBC_00508]WUD67623.1 MarR family transcriptional regulator [Nocardia sp. NBC_00508]
MRGTLNESQAAVLAVLAPGGMLTVAQLARDCELTQYRARAAVSALCSRGLVVGGRGRRNARYEITARGRSVLATRGRAFFPRPAKARV